MLNLSLFSYLSTANGAGARTGQCADGPRGTASEGILALAVLPIVCHPLCAADDTLLLNAPHYPLACALPAVRSNADSLQIGYPRLSKAIRLPRVHLLARLRACTQGQPPHAHTRPRQHTCTRIRIVSTARAAPHRAAGRPADSPLDSLSGQPRLATWQPPPYPDSLSRVLSLPLTTMLPLLVLVRVPGAAIACGILCG